MTSLLRYFKFDLKRNRKLLIVFIMILVGLYIFGNVVSYRMTVEYYRTLDFSKINEINLRTSMFSILVNSIETFGLLVFSLILTIVVMNQKVNTGQNTSSYNVLQLPLPKYIHTMAVYIEAGLFILVNYLMIVIISYIRGIYLVSKFKFYSLNYGIPIKETINMPEVLKQILMYHPLFQNFRPDMIVAGWFLLIGISCLTTILFSRRLRLNTIGSCLLVVALYFTIYILISFLSRYQFDNSIPLIIGGLTMILINIYLVKHVDY